MVNGVLYFTAGARRTVVAARAATGETLWTWRPDEGRALRRGAAQGAPRRRVLDRRQGRAHRGRDAGLPAGVARRQDRTARPRRSARPASSISSRSSTTTPSSTRPGKIGNSSPPVISNDVDRGGPGADARRPREHRQRQGRHHGLRRAHREEAVDVPHHPARRRARRRDVARRLARSTPATPASGGRSAPIPSSGYVYLSVESATNDVYGGHRPGNNLYSDSLVCLDIKTGKMIWYQQLVHHDIWDYDMPPAPILVDLNVDGRPVRAVVQLTKQAFAYVFDRTNGQSRVGRGKSGRCRRPTCRRNGRRRRSRSRPSRRPSIVQGVSRQRPHRLHAGAARRGVKAVAELQARARSTRRRRWSCPTAIAAPSWRPGWAAARTGRAARPIPRPASSTSARTTNPAESGPRTRTPTARRRAWTPTTRWAATLPTVQGLRLLKPPYGRITALDMNKGTIAWQRPNGDTPPAVKNNPALKGLTIPQTGSPSQADACWSPRRCSSPARAPAASRSSTPTTRPRARRSGRRRFRARRRACR